MMFWTGYYAKTDTYRKDGLKTVGISRTIPKGIKLDGMISELSPEDSLLWDYKDGRIDDEKYTETYLEGLDKIGIRNILLKIHSFGDDVVLLCWEAPEKFCHRHILADYINKNSKIVIEEYKNK